MTSYNLFMCILFCLVFTSRTEISQQCPENEYFDKCGTSCPLTCENPTPRECATKCHEGCFCKPGLVRDTEIQECVPVEECPGELGPCKDKNEEFNKCGPKCFATCSDPETECPGCKTGCFCREGFVRDDYLNYQCIPKNDCPNV